MRWSAGHRGWIAAVLALAVSACSGVPATSVYRGVEPKEVSAAITLSVGQAAAMVQQFAAATVFDPGAGVDNKPSAGSPWTDWKMPYEQHLRLERHEAGVWRLMTNVRGQWLPWHYQPERTATFVAMSMWRDNSEPVAVVAYGSDVVFLVQKVWRMRPTPRAGAMTTGFGQLIREQDWVDLDLSAILDDPTRWKLLLHGDELTLWVLPWKDGAVDPTRQGWRFALHVPGQAVHRMATRVKLVAGGVPPTLPPGNVPAPPGGAQ